MPAIYCHHCQQQFTVPTNTGECPTCGGGFVEEVPEQSQGTDHAAGAGGRRHRNQYYTRTFRIPGGGTGTVVVSGGQTAGSPFDAFNFATQISTGMPAAGGGDGDEEGMPGMPGIPADPYLGSVLDAMFGGGFLHPHAFPGSMAPLAVGNMAEQEWLDRLMTNIMSDYQPPSRGAAQRAVSSLPALAVRPKDAQGEAGEGQAVARAGEPCTVCHEEFREGEEVLELPCNHNFHRDCLLPWLDMHNTCPVCRHELPAEDPALEAERLRRAEAAAASGSGGRQGQGQGQQRGGARAGGSGNPLADLLSNISASWDSLRGAGRPAAPSPTAADQHPAADVASRSSDAAAAAVAAAAAAGASGSGGQPGSSNGSGAGASTSATGSAAADWARSSARPSPSAGPVASSGSGSSLRQRREAAAAAAERRLHGDLAAPAAGTGSAPSGTAAAAGGYPPAPAPAPPAASRPAGAASPQRAPSPPPYAPPPQRRRLEREEHGDDGTDEGSVAAGAVAGGVLGAILGGALMLLAGRRGRDRD